MNTHHESGVYFMSPVTLAHLRFPENHLMYVCVCVCVCVLVQNEAGKVHLCLCERMIGFNKSQLL